MEQLLAAIMGVVEGLTEFLPVSSTGHLILVGHLTGFHRAVGAEAAAAFEIVIQLAAILAVVAAYPRRFADLCRFNSTRGMRGLRGLWLLFLTSFPAAFLGLLVRKMIYEYLFNSLVVAWALAVGAIWMLAVEFYRPRSNVEEMDDIRWPQALQIGLFQCLSLWPGMSRAASTILGGMMCGLSRRAAAEYSFFAAVPLVSAAAVFKFVESAPTLAAMNRSTLLIGFAVSFLSAFAAVKLFIRFLSRYTLQPFGWYRLAVALTVFWFIWRSALSIAP